MPEALVQVTTTAPSEEVAAGIAEALLRARLAACVQVSGPIRSRYWWDGAVEDAMEWQCVAKTTARLAGAVSAAICDAHPYDVPEVLVTPVLDAADAYHSWVEEVTTQP